MDTSRNEHKQQFSLLFSELQPSLLTSLQNVIQNADASKEILQNVAAVLWEKYSDIDDKVRFRKIAYTVMRYEILSYRRDKARNRLIFDENVIALLVDKSSVSQPQISREQELLEKHLEELTPEQKKLLFDAYQSDSQIQSMAKEQGKTPMALYKKLQKIRSKLLENIQKELNREQKKYE